jgi:hypothetical protein
MSARIAVAPPLNSGAHEGNELDGRRVGEAEARARTLSRADARPAQALSSAIREVQNARGGPDDRSSPQTGADGEITQQFRAGRLPARRA